MGAVRSNVEDLLLVASLIDEFKIEIDLEEEVSMMKGEDSVKEGGVVKVDFAEKKVTKSGKIFYLMSQETKIDINEKTSLTCDDS